MGLFSRKKAEKQSILEPTPQELISIAEVLFEKGLPSAIEDSIQKQIDNAAYFHEYTQGDYFGDEFHIQATASRIKAAYSRESWIYASASLLARSMLSVPFVVQTADTKEIIPKHPLNKMLFMGNGVQSTDALKWAGYLDFFLGGSFVYVVDEKRQKGLQVPVEACSLKIDEKTRLPTHLMISRTAVTQEAVVPMERVVMMSHPNPYTPYYGMSIFTAASRPLLLAKYKEEFEMAFYLRGATNSGVIETTEDISKTRMERLMRTFEQVYTGKRNWWRTMFLPKGTSWKSSGLTMTEMQHMEGLRENRFTILAVLGIPPAMVGITQDVNRATSEVQEKAYWQNAIVPAAKFIASSWNNSYLLRDVFKGRVEVIPDFSEIEALQGSLITKGEQAKSVENYLLIDEIRTDILGYDELPDGKGKVFVSEIRVRTPDLLAQDMLSLPAPAQDTPPPAGVDEGKEVTIARLKNNAEDSQERVEDSLKSSFIRAYAKYLDYVLEVAQQAIYDKKDVRTELAIREIKARDIYLEKAIKPLSKALTRGFDLATSQVKRISDVNKKDGKVFSFTVKELKFREEDEQAIQYLREETVESELRTLEDRAIENFVGFNKTRTNEIVGLVASGLEEGKTTDQIAATIRQQYGQAYKEQAFTVARTELLSALSQGLKWNNRILQEVFSEVKKQWLHVGDIGSNPNARGWHGDFENLGPVDSDYKFQGMEMPRDPAGGAENVINCRCSMVSVIPDNARSNAELILDMV